MKITKGTLLTFAILSIISVSLLPIFGVGQETQVSNHNDSLQNINENPTNQFRDAIYTGGDYYDYGLNATAKFNRTVNFEHFGVASILDSIEVNIIGNVNLTYFNYTLPNLNTGNITFISFRVANNSLEDIAYKNATRTYTFSSLINYTTYLVPFYENRTEIGMGDKYYISVYIELAQPFDYTIVNKEQLLHFSELFYPLINNIPIISNSSVVVNKQGNDLFVDNEEFRITPNNSTENLILLSLPEQDRLEWTNITRHPFNYSQEYDDDLIMNVYVSSVSTVEALEDATNTILFKANYVHRTVEIDPYGLAIVTEEQNLVFLGPDWPEDTSLILVKLYGLNAFTIVLPANATILALDDEIGGLNLLYQLDEDTFFERGSYNLRESIFTGLQGLVIFPRSPLFKGDEMTFTIKYKVPLDVFLSREESTTNYKLRLSPCSIINWTVDELKLDIILPKGAVYRSYNYFSPDPYQEFVLGYDRTFDLSSLGFKRTLHFSTTVFSGSDNAPIEVLFTYNRANLWITYFFQIIAVGIIFAIYLGIRYSTKAAKEIIGEEEKESIPTDEVEEFVKQYEEVLALRERLRETRAKIASKKLKARQGKEIQTQLQKRLRAEEEGLKLAKQNLVQHGRRYKESVQKVEIAERKLLEERRNLRLLQQEYREKKTMTKESYVKLFRERQQTIEKLKNEINGILVTLRMLLEP
ncbi:MAG: hypothetical protein HGN29_04500 [Asgard group archaeon]|nr:hypothetical protein [Asgard group archaeon]